ncbi:ATP synthase E subunit [Ruminococcaceae bacterium P7]|nr:ATP synthase E subunit [Ruminococcaceae bacterium P7]
MNGGETIINRIKADCDESVASIRLDAEKANAAVLAEAEKQAQLRGKEIADSTKQKIAQIQAASKSRSELAARTALLKQRRAEIDKTAGALLDYLTGLGDNDYFNALYRLAAQLRGKSGELLLNQKDLQRLPSDFENRVREAGLDARVSQTPADILGGFILKSGDIEENMDFAALLNARRDEIEDLINRDLFAK